LRGSQSYGGHGGRFLLPFDLLLDGCPGAAPRHHRMQVADGTEAGVAWKRLVRGGWSEAERQQKRKALLEYCGQDTMALVRLVDALRTT
jgi:hypothetical protein